ncbi:MAG: hypothetical protein WAK17_11980 [Candidatus Nitrosopolaris sp.]
MYITNDRKCHKLLSNDGITSPVLVIDKVEGLFEGIAVNVKFQKTIYASIGSTSSLAKNLDEYQYIVCREIRSIPDINPYKKDLQKYRILIISSFAKLIPILASLRSDKNLQEWNRFAQILLTQVSETLVKARVNHKRYDGTNSKLMSSAFDFFGVPEEEVDRILQSVY